ncbi:MAG: cyclic nucleotide-binding domain-containing protein [Alphaproteobacteria bacterium]|jgi:CRP-like cAMP-binding protein|nr:cyclic nucleotide-binding domain-containing protein [Alphaproteobacteria bacterium]MDP6621005.1 cyclic nucleotide-binding domain-containing protein [Alphaproteobacteria bacterium]|tara:strand:+ start:167 stop:667 length:501 start_codon:yes stop_codon:yes gene_type:complete
MFGRRSNTDTFREAVEKDYQDGEIIVREGELGGEMFIIQEGSVRVTTEVEDQEVELAILPRGEFFGEMSLLESLPRSATVRAVGATRVQVVQPGGLMLKFRRDPTFAFEMLQRLSGRVRHINEILAEALTHHHEGETIQESVQRSEYERVEEPPEEIPRTGDGDPQ